MPEQATNPPAAQAVPEPSRVTKAWSLLYIEGWLRWYRFKVGKFVAIAAAVLILLYMVELIGPLTHLWPEEGTCGCQPPKPALHAHAVKYALTSLLFLTAAIMIWHHRRLHRKAERYRVLVAYTMLMEDDINSKKAFSNKDVVAILDSLIQALEFEGEKKNKKPAEHYLNASLVIREIKDQSPYTIYAQDSSGAFKADVPIPADSSVAGQLVHWEYEKKKTGALLYVPVTRWFHGVTLFSESGSYVASFFRKADVVEFSFKDLRNVPQEKMKCIACVTVPLDETGKAAEAPAYSAVLCLNGHRENCLDEIEFTALKLCVPMMSKVVRLYQKAS